MAGCWSQSSRHRLQAMAMAMASRPEEELFVCVAQRVVVGGKPFGMLSARLRVVGENHL
jgi:hypothetical protein